MFAAPHPRYRLYSRRRAYAGFLCDAILSRVRRGNDVERLERELALRFGVKHAICMPMARVGIHLAVRSVIRPGQRVIMSPYTIADVVNMVIAAGGRPVFADIERPSCNIDPLEVERLIDAETGAVLITHLHGIAARTDEIRSICRSHGVPLIEDAAQAFGAIDGDHRVGTSGDAGVFSFGMYKNINTWYGGAVVTDRDDLAQQIRRVIEDWPHQPSGFISKRVRKAFVTDIVTSPSLFKGVTYWIFRHGCLHDVEWINRRVRTELDTRRHDTLPDHYLARLTPFQARIALAQLDEIDGHSRARVERAERYHQGLADLPGLILPPPPDGLRNIYTYYPIQCEGRMDVIKQLMKRNRDLAPQHLKNCADLPGFSEFYRDCPNARATADEVLLLPTYPRYPMKEVERNIAALREMFSSGADLTPSRGATISAAPPSMVGT